MSAALVIFVLSYAAIVAGRVPFLPAISRHVAAVLGAVAMVLAGVVGPAEALRKGINWDTLLLLLGMMVISECMAEAQLFRYASWLMLKRVRTRPALLFTLVFVSGGAAAFLLNDTVCLMLTPLVLQVVEDSSLPPLPFLLALSFGANAGSSATPTGNPQNMIIATLFHIPYTQFLTALLAPALVSVVLVAAVLRFLCRNEIRDGGLAPDTERPRLKIRLTVLSLVVLAGVVAAFFMGARMSWSALAGAAVLVALVRRPVRILAKVDWQLLLFFAGLFVITYSVGKVGLAEALFAKLHGGFGATPAMQAGLFGLFTVAASQVMSNVPFVLLAAQWVPQFIDPRLMCLSMALFSTLGGNLTTIGSVANLIVLEGAAKYTRISFGEFLRYGVPVTVATLLGGGGVLLLEQHFGLF